MNNSIITTPSELQQLCQHLQSSEWLAVDTEFIREKTYYPQLALIQIANADIAVCVDPLALSSLQPLFELLENPAITKVLHASGQDLEIFHQLRQHIPQPLFDTQIAAALLGYGEQISYAALVQIMLTTELDKSHTRTDWQQRPLHHKQIQYALNDVIYLAKLYPQLRAQLRAKGRLGWIDSEQTRLTNPASYRIDPDSCWERVKGASKLKRRQLNVLKYLAAWRENIAADKDRPRRWIVGDDVLLNLAMQQPSTLEQLSKTRQMESKTAEHYGAVLLDLIQTAQRDSEDSWPQPSRSRKPTANEEALLDLLTAALRIKAAEQELSPGQLCSRGDLFRLIQGERELPILQGWRKQIAGDALIDTLEGRLRIETEAGAATLKPI